MQSRTMVLMELSAERNGDPDIENGLADTAGEGEWDRWRKWHQHKYTVRCEVRAGVRGPAAQGARRSAGLEGWGGG